MRSLMKFAAVAAMMAMCGSACAQPAAQATKPEAAETQFVPEVGQAGKDVIWVPTQNTLVDAMLKTAKVKPGELVIDLGSGDGRIPIIAARDFGARARGIEYNPKMVALSRENAKKEGVTDKVEFIEGDIFKIDFSQADVLTLYLLPELNLQLREDILKMKPGTRVVSNSFTMGDWPPDETINSDGGTGYFWIVPANAAGRWTIPVPGGKPVTVTIDQKYQTVTAGAARNGKTVSVSNLKLTGADLQFTLTEGGKSYAVAGKIAGDSLSGQVTPQGGAAASFTAARAKPRG